MFKHPHLTSEPISFTGGLYSATHRQGFASCEIKDNIANITGGWWTCREDFASYFKPDTKHFFFSVPDGSNSATRLALFFAEFERRLNLVDNTRFNLTTRGKEVVVFASDWWRESYMRRQLFTILLRCGVVYTGDFNEALDSQPYAKETRHAVDRFLAGFTKLDTVGTSQFSSNYGWAHHFGIGYATDIVKSRLAQMVQE